MSESFYNKDTVDAKLDSIHETLKEVNTKVGITNGRVRSLEKWRWAITGGLIVLGLLSAPNIGVIAKTFSGL